jgi:uncharacterized cofD-like protein
MNKKKVVVIGGGTGTYTVLSGLKRYPQLDLSVIVSMTDSGGSNRIIRDEFGLLPTSDIRQCMVALASDGSDETIRKLFSYRYVAGTGISGMTFGNLFLAALTDIYGGNQEKAIEKTCEVLKVNGQILPITFDSSQLVATYDNGIQVLGEHFIDEPSKKTINHKIVGLEVFPKAKVNKKAVEAIKNADLIILGPGDLYTSVLCNVVIDDVGAQIRKSKAKKAYVMNLMTRFGQTDGFTAKNHLDEIEKYMGGKVINYCLVNKSVSISKKALSWYRKNDATLVRDDLSDGKDLKIIRRHFASNKFYHKSKSDRLIRSLIRHDPKRLAKVIVELL